MTSKASFQNSQSLNAALPSAAAMAAELSALDEQITPLLSELAAVIQLEPARFDELALNLQELIAQRQVLTQQWLTLEDKDPQQAQWLTTFGVNTRAHEAQLGEFRRYFYETLHSVKANRSKVDLYKSVESKR